MTIMKKRLKTLILAAVCACMALFCASCASSSQIDDIMKEYPICVTIDFNGGAVGTETTRRVQAKENSLLLEPNNKESVYKAPEKAGYTLEGYYLGTKDASGNITFGKKWDFKTDRVTEDITLYVKWQQNVFLVIRFGENFASEKKIALDEYATEELKLLVESSYAGYTFEGFYYDEAFANPVPAVIDCKNSETDVVIYAKFTKNA